MSAWELEARKRNRRFWGFMAALAATWLTALCCDGATVRWSATVSHEEQYSAIGSWSGSVTAGDWVAIFGDGAGVKAKAYATEAAAKGAANGAYLGVYFAAADVPAGGTSVYMSDRNGPCWFCVTLTAGGGKPTGGEIEPGVWPIPEPTGGLLVALGLAALGLRRRSRAAYGAGRDAGKGAAEWLRS